MTGMSHDASGASNDVAFGYSYNPAGQIVGRTVSNDAYVYTPSVAGTNTFVDGLNRATSIGGVALSYDSNGNTTGVAGHTYGYDEANRLTSANAGAGASTFAFDPLNRLVTSTVGGASTRRQYVGEQLAAEYNPATGALLKRYIPGLGLDDVAVAYDGAGTATRTWQLADERGSVIAQSGATGGVSTINTYDEYGVPAPGNVGRFQYTGQQWLPEAGAYHYRARTYLPQTGRFLQTDPIGHGDGPNLYGYVGGDPVNLSDPFGLSRLRAQQAGDCAFWYWVDESGKRHYGGGCISEVGWGGPSGGIFGWSGGGGGSGSDGSGGGSGGPNGDFEALERRCERFVRGSKTLGKIAGGFGYASTVSAGIALGAALIPEPVASKTVAAGALGFSAGLGAISTTLSFTSAVFYGVGTNDWGKATLVGVNQVVDNAAFGRGGALFEVGSGVAGYAGDKALDRLYGEANCGRN